MIHHHLWQTRIDCVELSPPVVTAATGYFGFAPDERMRLTTGDALVALEAAPAHSYDVLFLDLFFDNGETPQHLLTDDFFRLCRSRLRPHVLLTMRDPEGVPNTSLSVEVTQKCPSRCIFIRWPRSAGSR